MKITACPKGYEEPGFDVDDWQTAEAEHAARLKQHLIDMGHTGEYTGEIISFGVADGSAQYMIVDGAGRYGKRTFLIHLGYGDAYQYRGVEHFPKAEVIKMAKNARAMAKMFSERKDWWADRTVGETVHYHYGFGNYVRGEIVETETGKEMKPTALVGGWSPHDLPSRSADGSISYPYRVRQIIEGETMKPNATNMFENEDHTDRGVDPTKLEPIDLSVPEMTADERELARLVTIRATVSDLLSQSRTVEDFKRSFQLARTIMDIEETV